MRMNVCSVDSRVERMPNVLIQMEAINVFVKMALLETLQSVANVSLLKSFNYLSTRDNLTLISHLKPRVMV
jgi:hypothetical protein